MGRLPWREIQGLWQRIAAGAKLLAKTWKSRFGMTTTVQSSHQVLSTDAVVARLEYFANIQVWPRQIHLDPKDWLRNFTRDEEKFATYLLSSFLFYSDEFVNRMFVGAIQSLSRDVVHSKKSFIAARGEWGRFLNSVVIVRVTGERPSDADSGYIFSRKARGLLGIPEARLLPHDQIVARLIAAPTTPVIFVDDFVGSGNQFITMWHRKYPISGSTAQRSLADIVPAVRSQLIFYCPLICTDSGREEILSSCKHLVLRPAHILDARYSVFHPRSIVWPAAIRADAVQFVEAASKRAGIPDKGGGPGDWRGYQQLGLTLGFQHGVPDATLPLFTCSKNGWRPLVRNS